MAVRATIRSSLRIAVQVVIGFSGKRYLPLGKSRRRDYLRRNEQWFRHLSGNAVDDSATHRILVETDGTIVGLASPFVNGVDLIDTGSPPRANVRMVSTRGNDHLDFSEVTFIGGLMIDSRHAADIIGMSVVATEPIEVDPARTYFACPPEDVATKPTRSSISRSFSTRSM